MGLGLDKHTTEEIKHTGPEVTKWLLELFNYCVATRNFSITLKKSNVIALLKPGENPYNPKSYRPISLLCHTYKLSVRLRLHRFVPVIDERLIPE